MYPCWIWNATAQIQPKLTTLDVVDLEIKIDKAKQQKTRWSLGSVLDQESGNLDSVSAATFRSAGGTYIVFARASPQFLLGNAHLSRSTKCFQWSCQWDACCGWHKPPELCPRMFHFELRNLGSLCYAAGSGSYHWSCFLHVQAAVLWKENRVLMHWELQRWKSENPETGQLQFHHSETSIQSCSSHSLSLWTITFPSHLSLLDVGFSHLKKKSMMDKNAMN